MGAHPELSLSSVDTNPIDHTRTSGQWDGVRAENVVVRSPSPHEFSWKSEGHYLALLDATRLDGETLVEGLPRSTVRDGRRKLIFIPAGCALTGWAKPGPSTISFTAAYIAKTRIGQSFEQQLHPMLHFENAVLGEMMKQLSHIVGAPEGCSTLYIQTFSSFLMAEINRVQSMPISSPHSPISDSPKSTGGLAGWQRRVVCDFIEEHLAEDISLFHLALLARLSPYHFCRSFARTLGKPPHRYQTFRRIERAKLLLPDSRMSVSEIAAAVGYRSASQFSAAFKRQTGMPPGRFRRS